MTGLDDEPRTYHLLDDSDYLETGTHIVFTRDGSLVFIQTIISSVGMYSKQPGLNVKVIPSPALAAAGVTETLQWATKFSTKDIVLSDEGKSIAIADNSFQFQPGTGEDPDSYVLSLPATGIGAFELTFVADGPSFMVSDGKVFFGAQPDSPLGADDHENLSYCRNVFPMARALTSGSFVPKKSGIPIPLEGRGFVSKLLQNVKGHKIANTWSLNKFDSDEATSIYVSFHTPAAYGSTWISLQALIVDSQLVAITTDEGNSCQVSDETPDPTTGYALPKATTLSFSGLTLGPEIQTVFPPNAPINCELIVEHESWIDRHDILSSIPWLLRMVVKTFIASPWSYRFYNPGSLTVQVGDEDDHRRAFGGMALREFIFLNKT